MGEFEPLASPVGKQIALFWRCCSLALVYVLLFATTSIAVLHIRYSNHHETLLSVALSSPASCCFLTAAGGWWLLLHLADGMSIALERG